MITTTPPDPGRYQVDEATYRAWPCASQSVLKLFDRSPLHARHALLHPEPPSPSKELGTATHCAILEPERFAREYVAAPEGLDRRTKAGKATWAMLVASGATILRAEEHERIAGMQSAVWNHPTARKLLEGEGLNELSVVWDEHVEPGPVRCKARIDRATTHDGWPTVIDVKTTRDAAAWPFTWDVGTYGYYRQAAMYLRALDSVAPMERRFLILAVESEAPHGIGIFELDEASIQEGHGQVLERLDTWARCTRDDEWPGYPAEIQGMTLPERFWRRE